MKSRDKVRAAALDAASEDMPMLLNPPAPLDRSRPDEDRRMCPVVGVTAYAVRRSRRRGQDRRSSPGVLPRRKPRRKRNDVDGGSSGVHIPLAVDYAAACRRRLSMIALSQSSRAKSSRSTRTCNGAGEGSEERDSHCSRYSNARQLSKQQR